MSKFLDSNGVTYLWNKIKAKFALKTEVITYTLQLDGNELKLVGSDGSVSKVTLPTSGSGVTVTDDGEGNVVISGVTITDNDGAVTISGASASDNDGNLIIS